MLFLVRATSCMPAAINEGNNVPNTSSSTGKQIGHQEHEAISWQALAVPAGRAECKLWIVISMYYSTSSLDRTEFDRHLGVVEKAVPRVERRGNHEDQET